MRFVSPAVAGRFALRVFIMNYRSALPIVLTCLMLLPACRGGKQGTAALERELRSQEHKIYTYTGYISEYKRQLDECREENQRLRGDGASSNRSVLPGPTELDGNDGGSAPEFDLRIPEIEIPMGEDQPPGESVQDDTVENLEAEMAGQLPPPAPTASREQEPRHLVVAERADLPAADDDQEVQLQEPSESHAIDADPLLVEELAFNHLFTGGNNTDGVPGDEGITLLVEPRNAQGDIVFPEGSLDISLLDQAAPTEEQARLGRWRLTADEVREQFHEAAVGRGIRLELPWQRQAPRRERLQLFVRFLRDQDGQQVDASRNFKIELPGRSAAELRRRRFHTAMADRRRLFERNLTDMLNPRQSPETTQENLSSAPAWDGGSSQPTLEIEEPQLVEPKRSSAQDSGWSRSRRPIPTQPLPKTAHPAPKPKSASRGQASANKPALDQAEPKIEISSSEPKPESAKTDRLPARRPPERSARKARPWSPYR